MPKQRSHTILHTYIDRHGRLDTRVNCTCEGATNAQASDVFQSHVQFAERAWTKPVTWNGVQVRITGIVLIDAAENVLAEWTHEPVEGMVAA